MRRFGSVVEVKPDKVEEYNRLHVNVWPGVLKMIKKCNINNYSIFLRQFDDGKYYLFSYCEYAGDAFDADMAKMAADATIQKWWDAAKPCHKPFKSRAEGDWWASMEEVFHLD